MLLIAPIALVFGLVIGSFLNVCIYRIPRGESVAFPPSHCPSCGADLKPVDLIPVLSWALLRGRCRYCKAGILWRYPVVELLTGLLFFGVALVDIPPATLALSFFMSAILVVTSFIDLDTKRIPNVFTYPAMLVGLLVSMLGSGQGLLSALLGLAVGGGSLLLVVIASRGGMGLGDAKLTAAIGACFGWRVALYTIFFGSIIGSIIGIALLAAKVISRREPIPFGPFLAIGACIAWVCYYMGYGSRYLF